MYLSLEDTSNDNPSGAAHGVFLFNSNAMQVSLKANTLRYHVTGGVMDFAFILGSSPADVVHKYTRLVGRPFLPPFWALGFHQSRWGYKVHQRAPCITRSHIHRQDIDALKNVVTGYESAELPLDVSGFVRWSITLLT